MELTRSGPIGFRINYSFIPERTPTEFVDSLDTWGKKDNIKDSHHKDQEKGSYYLLKWKVSGAWI